MKIYTKTKNVRKRALRFHNTWNEKCTQDKDSDRFGRIGGQQKVTVLPMKTNINNKLNSHRDQNQLSLLHVKPILADEVL